MRSHPLTVIAMTLVLATVLGAAPALAGYKGFERGQSLITVQELKDLVDASDPNLVIIAVTKDLTYKAGHIPGAVQTWRPDYEPKEGDPFPYEGMMLNRAQFQDFARNLGVNNDSKVVIYDDKYDATRVWWGFYLFGKTDCRVLDGGYQAWKAAGFDTDRSLFGGGAESKGNFTASEPLPGWLATMHEAWEAKTNPDLQLWDNREKKEWTGEELKKGAYRKGRIPWAKFLNWKEFKTSVAEGEPPTAFKTADEIQKVIDAHGMDKNKRQLFYCQSGVRTTTLIFGLYLMGWDPANLGNYDGSWIEWSYFDKNPITTEAE
jgi:thiosulfate/3-mercaptopyruvate sulfurtransferase